MRLLVLGSGKMGKAIAEDLAKAVGPASVEVVDADASRAKALGESMGSKHHHANLRDEGAVKALFEGADVAVSAADYSLNEGLTRAAIATKTHLVDLGGNIHVVKKQLAMDAQAREAGVTIIPDSGLAPGLAVWLAYDGVAKLKAPRSVKIRVGGLPANPKPPLDYSLVFSVRGLTNEYLEPAEVVREGKIVQLESMTDVEELEFPPPFGKLEAFNTSGGASTLPLTLMGKVRDIDYKTIRYQGHARVIKAMIDLGMLKEEAIDVKGTKIVPRQFTEAIFEKGLDHGDDDWVLVRVTVEGGGESVVYEIIDRKDPATGHSAMMRTTGYPTSIAALFLARGTITKRGVLPGELCIPVTPLIDELAARGVRVERR